MKNVLGLLLLLSLAGQPCALAAEAIGNSGPCAAIVHPSGNTSDTSVEDLQKLRKKYPLKPAKATKAEVQRAVDFLKGFDTAKMETVKIEDTRRLAAALRALAYAAQENLPEGSEFSPYLDRILKDGVIERIPAFPYNSYTDVRIVPVDFLSALPMCTPEQRGQLIEAVKGLMEFYKLNQKDAILKRTVNSDYLYNVLPHLFVCALHNPDDAQAAEDLRSFSRYLSACTQYVPGEKDILKPDGTGFHHKTHYNGYMYSYRTWVEYMGRLKGTSFRITRDAYRRMSKAIVSVYLMATSSASDAGHFYANSLAGRHPLYGLDVNFSKALFRELVEVGGDIDGKEFDPELAAYYNAFFKTGHYKGVAPRNTDGFYQFNYSPAGVYRQANWVATMRCPTTRFWGGEIYNKTNRFGRYQSHGTLEVMYEGSLEASGYPYKDKKSAEKGGWDWNVMPGATTVHYTDWKSMLPNGNNADRFDQWAHTTNFAGALAWGDCGLFAAAFDQDDKWGGQRFTPTRLSFCKSVFAIGGMLFSMGSGISAQGEYPDEWLTATNLFQSITSGKASTVINGKTLAEGDSLSIPSDKDSWIVNPCSTGYFIPAGNDPLIVRYGKQTTPSSFGLTEQGMGTMTAAKAYLLHGAKPARKKYQFLVVPATTTERMRADAKRFTGKGGIFEVRQQQDSLHIVKHTPSHTTAYALFAPATGLKEGALLAADSELLLLERISGKQLSVAVCNPDLRPQPDKYYGWISTPTNATLTFRGTWALDATSNAENVSVTHSDGQTRVTVTLEEGFPRYLNFIEKK
ncbi:polysaccharide lyase family 8 super-sandwich domain-containing protein [uncultured Bacteroides sp.]|uniref:polysaccharide lyase family 8 super-sandwich domain-containing protein n=1 Tax=uncultured Bacteroides sp. TaxID=162156 RepID=UPI0025ED774B|nr:polysaccharide lyase family 8 super-sandwich domain-containing protein [uncultured Bacteroides sp.]